MVEFLVLMCRIHTADISVCDFDAIAYSTRFQQHQLHNCHGCQMSHYSTSSQRCVHIYVMRLCCMGKWWCNPLFIERTLTDNLPEDVWKVKITPFYLNNAVLSNIYRTEEKQGHRCLLIDIKTGQGCHRIWVCETARQKQKSQSLCLEEVLITEKPWALFKKATGWVCCLCVFVHEAEAITHIYYQETAIQDFCCNCKLPFFDKRKRPPFKLPHDRKNTKKHLHLQPLKPLLTCRCLFVPKLQASLIKHPKWQMFM